MPITHFLIFPPLASAINFPYPVQQCSSKLNFFFIESWNKNEFVLFLKSKGAEEAYDSFLVKFHTLFDEAFPEKHMILNINKPKRSRPATEQMKQKNNNYKQHFTDVKRIKIPRNCIKCEKAI